ncbi:MAG: molecular chaperone DnaK (HSP70) [Pirellulaceae bacterium]
MSSEQQAFDPLVDVAPSRYVVGIDLGTTNSAVTYVDSEESPWQVRNLKIPQLVAPGQIENRDTLPSFYYQPAKGTVSAESLKLRWSTDSPDSAVGAIAREEGANSPGRMIASAKSWLCHAGVDRTAELLPWQAAEDVRRLSPVEVSSFFLAHVREAWNSQFPNAPFSEQDIVITLPASFDEVARELTIEAAANASLPRVTLIEEPQAAFYAWVDKHADSWQDQVEPGQKILVCDIGGGTSDFTLIRVRQSHEHEGKVQFHRVAVGNHLILGGDNLDLALAQAIEQQLVPDGKLEPKQWDVLLASSRKIKETLLGEDAPDQVTVNLPGKGSQLIGGSIQTQVTKQQVEELLVEGFLPRTKLTDKPQTGASGFQEFGLPYAADPAITRYLASFLVAHRNADGENEASADLIEAARPDVILFNGGFFASRLLRQQLLDAVSNWFRRDDNDDWEPIVFENERLDLAVARGASYYGMVRRGEGVKIVASLARSYYVGIDGDEPTAVCLVPGVAEPGQTFAITERQFSLAISQPVEFPLWVSSTRLTDSPGDLIQINREQMFPLPSIRTVLKTQRRSEKGQLSVQLEAQLTELGTIELWCAEVGTDRRWRLQFDVRSATQTDIAAHQSDAEDEGFVDEGTWNQCLDQLRGVFDSNDEKPDGLPKRLGRILETDRLQWPTSLLRRMWGALMELEDGRKKSANHEARWLNLLGFCLRPGFGMAVDDWRVAETWRLVRGKLIHHGAATRAELHVLWRRLAGGLSAGQQRAIVEPLLGPVRGLYQRFQSGKGNAHALDPNESAEVWRLLGSMELLTVPMKCKLGDMLVALASKKKLAKVRPAIVWSIGRLGQRVPIYGPLNTVCPASKVEKWLAELTHSSFQDSSDLLAVMQLARKTGDRHRDLDANVTARVVQWLSDSEAPSHLIQLVESGGYLDANEQSKVVGEALPKGLQLLR